MRITPILHFAAICWALLVAGCTTMNPFAADLGRTQMGNQVARPPYMSVMSYYGYLEAGATEGPGIKNQDSLYFWLPTSSPELGVRFLSRVNPAARPDAARDVVEAAYEAHKNDRTCFDPAIEVQRCLTVLDIADVARPCAQWMALGDNDDSVEMPPAQDGKLTNALVRVSTHPEDPLKSLIQGLYRINVRAAKNTTLAGTFLLQLGAPVLLSHVVMARNTESLAHELQAQAEHQQSGRTSAPHDGPAPSTGTAAPLEAGAAPGR